MDSRGLQFAGLELGSDKRTQIVCLNYFSQENKIFLDSIHSVKDYISETAGVDSALIQFFQKYNIEALGVDAPLSLPPCIDCQLVCPGMENCKVPSVVWMMNESEKQKDQKKNKMPIPYGQRPVDLLLRNQWKSSYVDQEAGLSANRAPLAARMTYLKKHLSTKKLIEVNPKLSMVDLAHNFQISNREIRRYRSLEYGTESRVRIVEDIARKVPWAPHVFLYNSEIPKLVENLAIFDAFVCALMAVYDFVDLLEDMPFSQDWGSVAKVKLVQKNTKVGYEEFY